MEEAAFLRAIAEAPDDDTPRLVYADWLQDRGDPRAEYLRLEVRRRRMTPREKTRDDPFYQLQKLRPHATPDWLSRIDRVNRFSMYWPQEVCRDAARDLLIGEPLARVRSRGNHTTVFPKALEPGDYLYVFTFALRTRTLFLVGRMRVERRAERRMGTTGLWTVYGLEGTEGTPIRFDLAVPAEVIARLSWHAGKRERRLNLDADGRMKSHESLNKVIRLTWATARDLDAVLRGEFDQPPS